MMRLTDIPECHHKVALEWFKGAEVQFSHEDNPGIWYNTDRPAFAPTVNYRVKPKSVEAYANIREVNGERRAYYFDTAHDAELFARNYTSIRFDRIAVKLVEA